MLMAKRDASGCRGNGLYYVTGTLLFAGRLPSRVDKFYALPAIRRCTISRSITTTYWLWHIGFGLIPFAQNPSSNLLLVTLLYPIPSVDLLPLWSWLRYDQ
jgi:hypothetical protein